MKQEQQSLISRLKEQRSVRKHLAVAVCLIAILTAFAVFWSLRISGLTLEVETATGTDATETDAGIATLSAYGLSVASEEDEEDEDTTSEDSGTDSSTTTTSSDTSDYYLAATVNADDLTSEDDYIIYTKIDDDYYVVSADGSLAQCTTVNSLSEADGDGPFFVESIGTVAYAVTGSNYANYYWNVEETGTSGSYYVKNDNTSEYLAPTSANDTTIGDFISSNADTISLSGDFKIVYTFMNQSLGTSNWQNYVFKISDSSNDAKCLYVRADNYASEFNDSCLITTTGGFSGSSITYSGTGTFSWDSWLAAMQEGEVVEVTITRTGTSLQVVMTAANATFTISGTLNDATDPLTIALTGQDCIIKDISRTVYTTSNSGSTYTKVSGSTYAKAVSSSTVWSSNKKAVALISELSQGSSSSGSGVNKAVGANINYSNLSVSLSSEADSDSNGYDAAWVAATSSDAVFYFAEVQETADNYHFAETVTLADAAERQNDSYVVYTQIGDTYYIVSAVDGSLLECTDISSYTDEDDKVLLSSAAGVYIWSFDETTGEPEFKFTTGTDDSGEDVFENYRWAVSSSDYDTTSGTGTYTLSNENNEDYLLPQLNTEEETVTQYASTSAVSLSDCGTLVYTVSLDAHNSRAFTLSAYISDGTTTVDARIYATVNNTENTPVSASSTRVRKNSSSTSTGWYGLGSFYVNVGDILTITIIRDSNGFYILYYDENTGGSYNLVLDDYGLGNDISIYLYADNGTYTVSAQTAGASDSYGEKESISNSETSDGSYSLDDGSLNVISDTSKSLKDDFDIEYVFTEISKNSDSLDEKSDNYDTALESAAEDNFAIVVTDGSNSIYVRANDSGWTADSTSTDNSALIFYTDSSSITWSEFVTLMKGSADCSVRVIRTGNTFFFVTTASGTVNETSYSYSFASYVTYDGFEGDGTVTVSLAGENCTLSGITYTNNTAREYYTTEYKRVSSVSDSITVTAVDTNGATTSDASYIWTATATGAYSESFSLIAQLATDTANTAEIEWVENASASAAASGTATTTLSNESVTRLSDTVVTTFSLARVTECVVWFDGTNGGMTPYTGATETKKATTSNAVGTEFTVTAPTASEATNTRYISYTLRGWYDIYNNKYYAPGSEITVDSSTVLYADWKVTSYDIGVADDKGAAEDDQHVVNTVSTNSFITTRLYDINDLFDVYSVELYTDSAGLETSRDGQTQTLYTTLSASSHSEVFQSVGTSATALTGLSSLNFLFFRSEAFPYYYYDSEGNYTHVNLNNYLLDYAANRSGQNMLQDNGTTDILAAYDTEDSGNTLLQMLYDTGNTADDVSDVGSDSFVYGKTYVGTADYLFQYNSTTGYYYYNSALNAASYNQADERFYVYDYVEAVNSGTSTSDFLPYNYVNYASSYTNGGNKISTNNANYWFGMSTEISFYLADDVPDGSADTGYGEVNLSIDSTDENQYHTTFKFSGDDDVWVFIDGELALDLGGVHGRIYGEIDFSTGEVSVGYTSNSIYVTDRNVLDYSGTMTVQEELSKVVQSLEAGAHTLTFYYLERGSGESNAAIYFNIASATYNLDLSKVDEDGNTSLDGAEFTFYTDSEFKEEAEDLENKDGEEKSTFSSSETVYGLKEGTLYYVVETASPDGYTAAGKYFTVILKEYVLTITVYDSSNTAQELYIYTITYDSSTGDTTVECTVTEDTEAGASVTNSSGWKYVLADENNLSVSAVITSGAVSYYNIGFKIANTKEYELPSTGSMGILPYRRAGTAFVLVSITGLLIIAFYHLVWVSKLHMSVSNKGYTEEKRKRVNHFARTRDHPRERSEIHGRDAPAAFAHVFEHGGETERSRGTGPGTE